MKRRLEEFGYSLCWRGDWISRIWAPIWFAYYCPYPVIKDWRAVACINAGQCGCSNRCRAFQ